jgi:hypothetical protein
MAYLGGKAEASDAVFAGICRDVLARDTVKVTRGGESLMPRKVEETVQKFCDQRRKVQNPDQGIVLT